MIKFALAHDTCLSGIKHNRGLQWHENKNILITKKQLLGQPTLGLKPSRTARQHWDASKCFGPGLGGNITDATGIINGIARLVLLD